MFRTNRFPRLLALLLRRGGTFAARGGRDRSARGAATASGGGAPSTAAKPRVDARLLVHPDDTMDAWLAAPRRALRRSIRVGTSTGATRASRASRRSCASTSRAPSSSRSRWPAPSAFTESEGLFTTYGYAGRVLLATRAVFGAEAAGERIARVHAELLVCEVECIPASLDLERRLGSDTGGDAVRAVFDDAASRVPLSAAALGIDVELEMAPVAQGAASGSSVSGSLRLRPCLGEPRCRRLSRDGHALIPDRRGGLELDRIDTQPDDAGGLRVVFQGRQLDVETPRLTGVLALVDADGRAQAVELDLALPGAQPVRRRSAARAGSCRRSRWPCSAVWCSTSCRACCPCWR